MLVIHFNRSVFLYMYCDTTQDLYGWNCKALT